MERWASGGRWWPTSPAPCVSPIRRQLLKEQDIVTETRFDKFRVPKATGTHADVFAAVGLADLLSDTGEVTIRDDPTGFTVKPGHALSTDDLRRLRTDAGYQFL